MIKNRDTKYTKLFVGGIPYESDDDALRSFFTQFGEIDEAVVIRDRVTKRSKGYGFVSIAQTITTTLFYTQYKIYLVCMIQFSLISIYFCFMIFCC